MLDLYTAPTSNGHRVARGQVDRLSRTLASVPIRKPMVGGLEATSGFGMRTDPFTDRDKGANRDVLPQRRVTCNCRQRVNAGGRLPLRREQTDDESG